VLKEQTKSIQEQQHASVWPRLLIAQNIGNGNFGYSLSNKGVGPAQIKKVVVRVDRQPQKDWDEVVKVIAGLEQYDRSKSTINNRIVRQGDSYQVLEFPARKVANKFIENSERVSIEICYCSIYDRCWSLLQDFSGPNFALPAQVASCEPSEDEIIFLD